MFSACRNDQKSINADPGYCIDKMAILTKTEREDLHGV